MRDISLNTRVTCAILDDASGRWNVTTHAGGQVTARFMPYLGGVGPYRAKCDEIAAAGYEGFALA